MKKIILSILPLLLLTGCYNYQELNEIGIITAIEIDKKDDLFKVTAQIVNPKNQNDTSSANQPYFITYTNEGKTIQEATRGIVQELSRKIYGMHMQVLLVTENLAKEDLTSMYDFFFRNSEIRKEFYVLVDTSNKDDKLLDILTPITNLSSKNIVDTLTTDNKFAGINSLVTFNDMMDIYLDPHKELVLPTINIKENKKEGDNEKNLETTSDKTDIILGNLGIFKDNKYLGELTKRQSIDVNLIKGNVKETLFTYKCDNNKNATIKILLDKSTIHVDTKNLKVKINLKGTGSIAEYSCNDDLNKEEVIKKINKKLNNQISKSVEKSIKEINDTYNSDIYQIRDIIYKKDFKFYNKHKDNYYEKIFKNLEFNVKSNFELQGKGNLLGGTYEIMED